MPAAEQRQAEAEQELERHRRRREAERASERPQEALLGKIAAEDALKNTATAWEKITNQIGRRQQIDGWKALKAAYPTKNVPD